MNPPFLALPAFHATMLTLHLACRGAWLGALRGWQRASSMRRRAAAHRDGLRELHAMDDRMLSDIGMSRCDLPWVGRRDAFVRLLDDIGPYSLARGVSKPPAPVRKRG